MGVNEMGKRLAMLRAQTEESQRDLADVLHVTNAAICRWENSNRGIPAWAIPEICKHYNVSADWFIGLRDKKSGLYECFHCGQNAVSWDADFDFDDYGIDGEGVINTCHCNNCGAHIEYYVGTGEAEE